MINQLVMLSVTLFSLMFFIQR
ncbi:hypothetical protein XBI1_2290009 [Xenorhabdus bovienii str. Intermedium]|uniref:Uncharacterized protein n=1 Tax=Xenorhabdus bovienii str. Intermedium TaxID=1379677 RepID=A0A077QIA5_XENBV|nr:hypothetical protein XBI1_2290009 [Xenorhabdus bovienii str. Intermedium]